MRVSERAMKSPTVEVGRSRYEPAQDPRKAGLALAAAALSATARLGLHDRSPASGATALALIELDVVLVVAPLVLVVVGQLQAGLDVLPGVDEDLFSDRDRLAVGIARVVDVARVVPLPVPVDDGVLVESEKEGMVPPHLLVLVAAIALVGGDPLAGVFDDALSATDTTRGEDSPALNARPSDLVQRRSALRSRGQKSWKFQSGLAVMRHSGGCGV